MLIVPPKGTSNGYLQHVFNGEIEKIMQYIMAGWFGA